MSSYPCNPPWFHVLDIPITILSRTEWNAASAAGYLTPEHVLARLKNIADYVFGYQTAMGLDQDGFVSSLISAGLSSLLQAVVREQREVLATVWETYHGEPVTFS